MIHKASSFFWLLVVSFSIGVSATPSSSTPTVMSAPTYEPTLDKTSEPDIRVVFSDLDGTLLHYPETPPKDEKGNKLLRLPPSSTGMRGVVSSKTLALAQTIRERGGQFVLVSGMRTSTFLRRLPYLPRADAYCMESGGRIFYPTTLKTAAGEQEKTGFVVKPVAYDGASKDALESFGLVEDLEWRKRMEQACGNTNNLSLKELEAKPGRMPPLNELDGLLWDFARDLGSKGFVLDTKGYSTCFRVNKKQQPADISNDDFASLSDGRLDLWDGLATSVNLSCVDFYPASSGKKNCCQYLIEKIYPQENVEEESRADNLLGKHAVCLCDDDNDVEMAKACHHAFIPDVTSQTMRDTINADPSHFTQTGGDGAKFHGTSASEAALELALKYFQAREAEL